MLRPFLCLLLLSFTLRAQPPGEDAYYRIEQVAVPDGIVLEVGGMAMVDADHLAVCTRRGEVWVIGQLNQPQPTFHLLARGLHEPLGLAYAGKGVYYATQRGELTRITDHDGDFRADRFETVYRFALTGNYHEYAYGPVLLPGGDLLVTLNLGWEGRGVSKAPWRGWLLRITPDGRMTPLATGLRSPAGFGLNEKGDIFYTENQGDWVGSGRMTHLRPGDFAGNPAGLAWSGDPRSPIHLRVSDLDDSYGTLYEAVRQVKEVKPPSVWFPHGLMGISTAGFVLDTTGGHFGPFAGQMLVSDQGQSKLMRVFQEQVNGVYQGACFPFREGFSSGTLRLTWGPDHALYVGQTSRGWSATGEAPYALEKLVWTGQTPFEVKAVRVRDDGFELEFTWPVDPATAARPASYALQGFTYRYHQSYGSPVIDLAPCPVTAARVSDDGLRVHLTVDGLRTGYVHEVRAAGVRSARGGPLLHNVAYYTLNQLPGGAAGTGRFAAGFVSSARQAWQQAKRVTTLPAAWAGQIDETVVLHTAKGMRYAETELTVRAGSRVKFTLVNPDDMQHNVVLTQPDAADAVGEAALAMGLAGAGLNYVPDVRQVLYHSQLVQPGESDTFYFTAPRQPGRYPYVCTVPGHYKVMRGVLVVRPAEAAQAAPTTP